MRVVIAPATATARAVRERLVAWSAADLLRPCVWWEVAPAVQEQTLLVDLVAGGSAQNVRLPMALEGSPAADVRLVAFHPAREAEGFDPAFATAVERCVAAAREVLVHQSGRPVECTMVVAPADIGQPVSTELFRAVWSSNLYVAPEDRADPDGFNHLPENDSLFPAHAAHALATICQLWARSAAPSVNILDRMAVTQAGPEAAPVRVVRCFSRAIDFGFLPDQIAARVFQAGDAWPNPDPQRFDRVANPATVVPHIVRAYLERHREVLDLSPFDPVRLPEVQPFGLLEALKLLIQELWARLRQKPFELLENAVAGIHDMAAARIEKLAGPESDIRVRRWRDHPPDRRGLEDLEQHLVQPLIVPDGPVGPAWMDLRALTLGLVDGAPLPEHLSVAAMTRGTRRALVTDPRAVAPDPTVRPPQSSGLPDPRACDPLHLDPRFGAPVAEGDPPPTLDRQMWSAPHRETPLWMVGASLAQALTTAQAEGGESSPRLADALAEDKPAAPAAPPAKRPRLRRALLMYTALAGFAGYEAWIQLADWVYRAPALVLIVFLWLVAIANAARKKFMRDRQEQREVLQKEIDKLNGLMLRAQRAGDAIRLDRRYREFLDWAEILGTIVHRPWVGEPLEGLQVTGGLDRRELPAAFSVGVATYGDGILERVATRARGTLYRPAWLSQLYDSVETGTREVFDDAAGFAEIERPNPAADTTEDPQSPRRLLLGAARRGDGRRLKDNELTLALLGMIDTLEVNDSATSVAQLTFGSEADPIDPLPPSTAWFSPPANIRDLAGRVESTVVRVSGESPKGRTSGAGVIVQPGLIATARHLVEGTTKLAVRLPGGSVLDAAIERVSLTSDLALVSVASELAAATLAGPTDAVRQGEPVVTISDEQVAHADSTVTWGLVSAATHRVRLHRAIGQLTHADVFQATFGELASPEGSPVFDLDGRLVGLRCGPGVDGEGAVVEPPLTDAVPIAEVHRLMASRAAAATVAATPAAPAAPAPSFRGPVASRPAQFISELLDASRASEFLPQHWARLDVPNAVEEVIQDPEASEETRLGRLAGAARFLHPVRLTVHRVEVTAPMSARALASCAGAPEPPAVDDHFEPAGPF